MRRIAFGLLGLLGVLLGTALIVPFFFNVNDYKPQIIAKAKESLGRNISIEGKISLHLLPMPKISIEQVGISNIPGGSPQDLMRIKRLDIAVDLFPLLKKQIKIKTVELDHPAIYLEKLPNGQTNWSIAQPKSLASAPETTSPSTSFEIALDKVLIHNGRLMYHEKGKDIEIQDINASSKLDSLQGPFEIAGTFKTFGQNIKLDSKIGALGDVQDIALKVQVDESTFTLDGKASLSPLTFNGHLKAVGDSKLFTPVIAKAKSPDMLSGPLRVESALIADLESILFNQAKFEIGTARPTGDIKVVLKEALQVQGNLKNLPGEGQCSFTVSSSLQGLRGSVNATLAQTKQFLTWLKIDTNAMPPEVLGQLKVSTQFNANDTIRLNDLNLDIRDAKLQGDVSWQSQQGGPLLVVDLQSPKIENVLKLMGIKDPKPFGMSKLKGNIHWNAESLQLTQLKGQLGANFQFSGNVAIDQSGNKPKIKAVLSVNSINLSTLMASRQMKNDPYPEAKIILVSTKHPSSGSRWSKAPMDFSFLSKFDGQFDISSSQLKHEDITISHPKLRAIVQNGRLDISPFTGSLFGGALVSNGYLTAANSLHFHIVLKDANLKNFSTHGTTVKIVGGKLFLTADLSTQGGSQHAMIQNLKGPVNIAAKDGMINGFDLQTLSQRLGSLQNPSSLLGLLNTSMGKGQTPFSSFKGDIVFKNGVGTIQSMNLIAKGGQGQASGQIDLPNYLLNVHAEFRLTEHPKIPPFQMKLTGPIDNPSRRLDTNALQKYMVENVFKGVIEKLGKGKLKGGDIIGSILGGGEKPAPDQQPNKAPSNNKPEQIVKDIFKGIF